MWAFIKHLHIVVSLVAVAGVMADSNVGQCEFDVEPVHVGHFWDPTCADHGGLGCDADGKNSNCRFCGAGEFVNIPCPPSACSFINDPYVSFFWDPDCEIGELGCWADGVHKQCRFCGDYPYTSVPCPGNSTPPSAAACSFANEPEVPYYWDPMCELGMHGCNADGVHVHCRYCGAGGFVDVRCPASQVCDFEVQPSVPYYWDPTCHEHGGLGCNADGVHMECRYCAQRPFEDVPCPEPIAPPKNSCTWPLRGEPHIPYFWDERCTMGMLGCWADGIHAQCRFCGYGVFSDIKCLNTTEEGLSPMVVAEQVKTPICVAGTTDVYQPSPGSGKCYCGSPWETTDRAGYCDPFPVDQGISSNNCSRDTDDPHGRCGYYCVCGAPNEITCCTPGSNLGLVGNVVIERDARRLRGVEYV